MSLYPSFGGALIVASLGLAAAWFMGTWLDFLLANPLGSSPIARCFSRLTLGNTALAVLTAVLTTRGETVLLAIVPVLLFLRGERVVSQGLPRELRVSLILAFLGLFCFGYLRLVDPWSGLQFSVSLDEGVYGRFVRHVIHTGNENYRVDVMPGNTTTPEPYHYGDLWHAAFFVRAFSANAVVAYVLFSATLLWLNIAVGAAAIIDLVSPTKHTVALALGLVALGSRGVSWLPALDLPLLRGDWWNYTPLTFTKAAFVAVWVTAAFLMWVRARALQSATCLLVASLLYLVVAPGIGFAIPVILFLRWRRAHIRNAELLLFLSCIGCIVGWMWFLYAQARPGALSMLPANYYVTGQVVLRGLRVLASTAFKVVMSYVPLFVLWKWAHHSVRTGVPGIAFFALLHTTALLAYAVLHAKFDSVQHWSVLYMALATPAFSVFLGQAGTLPAHRRSVLLLGSVGLGLLMQGWSRGRGAPLNVAELVRVRDSIGDLAQPATIGFIQDASEMKTVFDRNFLVYPPIPALLLVDDRYNPICISVEDIPEDALSTYHPVEVERKAGAPISLFVSRLKREGRYVDYPSAQANFVRTFGLRWILLSPRAAMPVTLWPLVERRPVLEDIDGWRWYRVPNSGAPSTHVGYVPVG